ncbi:MAG: hypothetical protein J6N76_07680 [Lachnospiraceae bacterium]|nr:hypothetical protein [Lachnospiraceae bacterium]
MYQDAYAECNVARKNPPFVKVLTGIMIAMCVITLLWGFFLLAPLMLAVFLVLLVMNYFQMLNSNLEYEYLYVSGELDFDVIKWQRSRKRIKVVNLDNVTVIAPTKSDRAKAYGGRNLKTVDYSSRTGADTYLIAYKDSGSSDEQLIIFEPDERMINTLKAAAPNKVSTNEY